LSKKERDGRKKTSSTKNPGTHRQRGQEIGNASEGAEKVPIFQKERERGVHFSVRGRTERWKTNVNRT